MEGAAGEQEGGDILVRLLSNCQSCLLALPLHSHVLLSRSEFFAVRLSERWANTAHPPPPRPPPNNTSASDEPPHSEHTTPHALLHEDHHMHAIDIIVPEPSCAATYKRCMELMYVPREDMNSCRPFSGVDDALCMLHVAAVLLFHDGIDACMQYLEMLPSWTPSEEASIRSALSSLQVTHINTDLAARLSLPQGVPADHPMLIIKDTLVQVLQLACKSLATPPSALKSIDPSKPIPDSAILAVWNAHMDLMKRELEDPQYRMSFLRNRAAASSTLKWLFDKLLVLRAADAVAKAFTEDIQLSTLTKDYLVKSRFTIEAEGPVMHGVISLLDAMMQAFRDGQVLLSRSSRFAFMATWLAVGQTMNNSMISAYPRVIDGFHSLLSSLPAIDRGQFLVDCTGNQVVDFSSSFGPWCDSLREAHLQLNTGQDFLLVHKDTC